MKLAILGGSFNPVHLGHLFLADEALSSLNYDRVVMIPAYRSPFKLAAQGMETSGADRLEMLAASIEGDPRLTVDDCEIRREGVSYTIDTLKDIIARYAPRGRPALVIGDDLAADFLQWHKSDEILALADIIVARRVHSENSARAFPHIPITNEIMEISSGMVRGRIAANKAWRSLVPAAARTLIEERGLYGCAAAAPSAPRKSLVLRVEEAARRELPRGRFLHSRNTALLAWDLCRRFNIDPEQGYLAGIAHDLAKPLDDTALLALAQSDGGAISKLQQKKPALLHGRAAAVLLRERFGVSDTDILEAAALHTEGGGEMRRLSKILYIADKMEVSREKVPPALRAMCYANTDLDKIFFAVLENTVAWLRSRGLDMSEETLRLLEKTKGETA